MPIARSIAQVNKAIQKKYPLVFLVRGEGNYYVASDDKKWGEALVSIESGTSIYSNRLNSQSVEAWVQDVENIVKKIDWEEQKESFDPNEPVKIYVRKFDFEK